MKTAAIYARVSTSDQSAESQLMELRANAQRRGFTIYREYVDQVTGVISKRKAGQGEQFKCLMDDARQKRFDVLMVWKFDRFARSLQTLIESLQLFQTLDIDFISATQNIDTTTAMGRLFFQIVGSFAEFEREMIVERVRAGLANAKSKGVQLGRRRSSAPWVEEEMLRLHREGKSHSDIAQMMGRSRAGVGLVIRRALLASGSAALHAATEGSTGEDAA